MNKVMLYAEDSVFLEDLLYCVYRDAAVLYSIDFKEKKINILGNIPDESFFIRQSFRKILVWNDELIFVPYNARCVHLYNIVSCEWRKSACISEDYNKCMYYESFVRNNRLVMIGADEPNIIEMNLDDLSYRIVNTCFERYKKSGEMICRGGFSIVDNYLYLAIATKNVVVAINLDNWNDEEFIVGTGQDGFSGILKDNDKFWLAPRNDGNVIIWDAEGGIKTIKFPFALREKAYNFGGVCSDEKYIYLPGQEGKYTVSIEKNSGKIEYYEKQYIFLKTITNNIVLGQVLHGDIEIYKNNKLYCLPIMIDRNQLNKLYNNIHRELIFDNHYANNDETVFFSLKEFLGCIG